MRRLKEMDRFNCCSDIYLNWRIKVPWWAEFKGHTDTQNAFMPVQAHVLGIQYFCAAPI
jgi:hypothetical protein